jgi:hypothetical protein
MVLWGLGVIFCSYFEITMFLIRRMCFIKNKNKNKNKTPHNYWKPLRKLLEIIMETHVLSLFVGQKKVRNFFPL